MVAGEVAFVLVLSFLGTCLTSFVSVLLIHAAALHSGKRHASRGYTP